MTYSCATLTAGQSLTVRIPNLYIAVSGADQAELVSLTAIALGSGTGDRSVEHVVPEPSAAAGLTFGLGLLAWLSGARIRSRRRDTPAPSKGPH